MPARHILLAILCAALPAAAWAQAPVFRAAFSRERVENSRLEQFAHDGLIRLSGKEDKIVGSEELIDLRREQTPLPARPTPPFLLLTTGEYVPLAAKPRPRIKDGRVVAALASPLGGAGKETGVPLPYVALLCLEHPHGEDDPEVILARTLATPRKQDLVLLVSGDQIEGKLTGVDGKECTVETADRIVATPLREVAAAVLNPERLASPRPKGRTHRLAAAGGARIDFQSLALDPARGVLSGKTLWAPNVEVALTHLAGLHVRNGRAVYLSDLPDLEHRHEPGLGMTWPLGRDQTFLGRPIRLADGVHDKGLSMPTGSMVVVKLPADAVRFEALVGMDSRDGRLGDARLEVLLDGKKADIGPGHVRGGDAPLALRIDLGKARVLTLFARTGSRPGVQAVVNWADARLVK